MPAWQRGLIWAAGVASLVLGLIGTVVPLLPTVPFVLLAALCFARASPRSERWLLAHPRLGPMVRDWRARRAVPRRAKWLAVIMMGIACIHVQFAVPMPWNFAPLVICVPVAIWLWRLPDAA